MSVHAICEAPDNAPNNCGLVAFNGSAICFDPPPPVFMRLSDVSALETVLITYEWG